MGKYARDSRRVVLFLPPYEGKTLGPPLGLLSLAGALRQAGYEPDIVDGSLLPDYRGRVIEAIGDCLCFGVSLLTGPMILDAIQISRAKLLPMMVNSDVIVKCAITPSYIRPQGSRHNPRRETMEKV